MKKFRISLGVILLIICGVLIFKTSSLDIKNSSTIVDSDNDTIKTSNNSTSEQPLKKSSSSAPSSNNSSTTDDYSVLVQSPIYDAVVQLDRDSKEINVKVLDDSNIGSYDTDKYINLTEEDVNYLKENANDLLKEFENGSMLDKYSFVSKMLKGYDTNINMGDLISIAMSYLK